MIIIVEKELCTGHGLCALRCPEIYTLDANGYIDTEASITVPEGLEKQAKRGARSCPERALKVVE